MCLLVVAWMSHPRYRLVIAGNRDEFHDRPAAALGWWNDGPGILAGRDLRAGGTWLGLSRSGRIGCLTNFRDAETGPPVGAPSRGALVTDYLRSGDDPASHLDQLHGTASRYAGFNLLLGDRATLYYYSNVGGGESRALAPGIYGLSNHRLDEPWPKLVRTRERVAAVLATDAPAADALFVVLGDHSQDYHGIRPGGELPADLESALTAPFVRHPLYGTRSSTVVLVAHDGRSVVHERRWDAGGTQTGATRIEFRDTTT
jgi:uncharacterized protein with NRDE domain